MNSIAVAGADLGRITGISPDGTKIRVADGLAKRVAGGLQFYAQGEAGQPFSFFYDHVKVVRDGQGKPVWVNSMVESAFPGHCNQDQWKIRGSFIVELMPNADTTRVPLRTFRDLARL